ncbi:hypothetical protein QAD02_011164 [Eretmocerus hayati]|uniref:Uncharacterized protein n=1 Tax=Eretmocerus hayati TaxID=131215 RepID=A0ACC2NWZ3_9HYME|nr:hypothetical protein QAD02_011164 [Eretmocerus hayati]
MVVPNDLPQVTHLRTQILLVWIDYGMRSVMLMNEFISSGCQAIEIPVIAREAATFFRLYRELSDHYGDRSSYARIFLLPHIERIDHGNYPNSYKAVVMWAKRSGAFGQNDSRYLMSNVNATVSDQILADYFARGIRRMAGIDDVTRGHLEVIGYLTRSDDDDAIPR